MVKVTIDMKRRENLRRLHTATHIVNFAARKVLGNHVWQNGSNLKEDAGTLDITHFEALSLEQIFEIEKLANEVVFENRKVSIEELDRTLAEKKYGFVLYQGGAIPMKTLRVVSVEDSDIEACGGIHMESTAGIGIIKVVESSKISDGVVRLKFVVRDFALENGFVKQKILAGLKGVFSVEESLLVKTGEKFFSEWKEQKKEIEGLKKQLKELYVSTILGGSLFEFDLGGSFEMGFVMEVFSSVLSKKKKFCLRSAKFVIATPEFEVKSKKVIDKGSFKIYVLE